jgi:hypothetical protein
MGERNAAAVWRIGERVATPNGLVAEILAVYERRALIRYLGPHLGPDEILLPYSLLRPATARDLLEAGIR